MGEGSWNATTWLSLRGSVWGAVNPYSAERPDAQNIFDRNCNSGIWRLSCSCCGTLPLARLDLQLNSVPAIGNVAVDSRVGDMFAPVCFCFAGSPFQPKMFTPQFGEEVFSLVASAKQFCQTQLLIVPLAIRRPIGCSASVG
jgi:hypothetical protein